ncbi:MAG: acetate--CoA ligase family protein [Syntrophobacterales bacterium]|nr:acetate--CoA ligase family protein [Syntrophobacterales bacterium]
MKNFFTPDGVIVVGATSNPIKGGNAIVKNLQMGYKGPIYPVNPRYAEIEGLACYPSVTDVPGKADLAIVFVPASQVSEVVEKCAAKGIPGVMIESGGFAETGPAGAKFQTELLEIAARTGIRIWGPNCMGLVDVAGSNIFSFMVPEWQQQGLLIPGRVSLVVQSGMLSAVFLVDIMTHALTGIAKVCSLGNKVDINECDILEYFMDDPQTDVIGMYLESFADGRRFLELARCCTKPIVVLKGGKSEKGAEAAMSHTASLAGNRRIVSGLMRQAGVIEATDFRQMADICRSLALTEPAAGGKRTAILTFSGGAGIVSTDFVEEQGLALADFSPETKRELEKLFPSWMPVSNPVDLWPAIESHLGSGVDVQGLALSAVLADPGVDAVFLHLSAGNIRMLSNLSSFAALIKKHGKPLVAWLVGKQDLVLKTQKEALFAGIPVFTEIGRAAECLRAAIRKRRLPEGAPEVSPVNILPKIEKIMTAETGALDEHLSKQLLAACGIPTVLEAVVNSAAQAEGRAAEFGFPVVMKGLLPGAIHKTELDLVRLGIADGKSAREKFAELDRKMENRGKVLLQKQIPGKVELILGLLRDPQLGACVMCGIGGIAAELYEDAVFAVAPLTLREAREMIAGIRGQKLLDGFRGSAPVDREELARIIVRMGEIGLAFPQISEIDINPLLYGPDGAVAVDATVVLR